MERLERCLILTVINDAIDELMIINKGSYTPSYIVAKKPVKERFESRIHESVYKELDPFQKTTKELNDVKLCKDINTIITILSKTYNEIAKNNTFEYALKIIEDHKKEQEDERRLMEDYKTNLEQLERLKQRMTKRTSNSEIRMHATDEAIAKLRAEVNGVQRLNRIEMDLVIRWEQTRMDQALILIKNGEKELEEIMRRFKIQIESEKRVIHDLETYNELLTNEYKKLLLIWQDKYETEMAELFDEIKAVTKQIFAVKKKYEKHVEISETRKEFIAEYRAKKAEEQRLLEFQQFRVRCAIRIQAWWRGTMVRRGLGPYKRKKGKGKGKGGGKKGK